MAAARDIDPLIMQMISSDWQAAPHGGKSARVKHWAALIGVAPQTIYRALPTNRERKKGARQIPGDPRVAVATSGGGPLAAALLLARD